MFPITYRKAENNSWIQCFRCGLISHNPHDAIEKFCARCDFHHVNGIVEESSRLGDTPGAANREQKLVVALFLALGKAMAYVPPAITVSVSEQEIGDAWKKKVSPVRLTARDEIWGSNNVFQVVRGVAKMVKDEMPLKGNMPKFTQPLTEKPVGRVFDFD